MDSRPTTGRGIVVFSGGSAANHLVDVFNQVAQSKSYALSYVIPISDNGGSSSELIRVFGGPGIGDVRSRLVRLIPDDGFPDMERPAIKTFFNHRLSTDSYAARIEWLDIVEARDELWRDISSPKKELIRSFLNLLNLEIVKRARPSSFFNFQGASIGNMFLTGARLFSGSFESAIYLLSSICTIPPNVSVLPAINTNFSHHICAGLANGDTILGQNAISHPSEPTALPSSSGTPSGLQTPMRPLSPIGKLVPGIRINSNTGSNNVTTTQLGGFGDHSLNDLETETADTIEDANLPGSLPTLRKPYLTFSKSSSSIPTTTAAMTNLHTAQNSNCDNVTNNNSSISVVHSTTTTNTTHSVFDLPARITRLWYINPYGQEIRLSSNPKIPRALDHTDSIIYSIGSLYTSLIPSLILRGVGDAIARRACSKILILNGSIDRETRCATGPAFTASDFVKAIAKACIESRGVFGREARREEMRDYVTHVVYVEGDGTPRVQRDELGGWGVECVRVYGRKAEEGCRYDENALRGALEALVGNRDGSVGKETRRRYTLES